MISEKLWRLIKKKNIEYLLKEDYSKHLGIFYFQGLLESSDAENRIDAIGYNLFRSSDPVIKFSYKRKFAKSRHYLFETVGQRGFTKSQYEHYLSLAVGREITTERYEAEMLEEDRNERWRRKEIAEWLDVAVENDARKMMREYFRERFSSDKYANRKK